MVHVHVHTLHMSLHCKFRLSSGRLICTCITLERFLPYVDRTIVTGNITSREPAVRKIQLVCETKGLRHMRATFHGIHSRLHYNTKKGLSQNKKGKGGYQKSNKMYIHLHVHVGEKGQSVLVAFGVYTCTVTCTVYMYMYIAGGLHVQCVCTDQEVEQKV